MALADYLGIQVAECPVREEHTISSVRRRRRPSLVTLRDLLSIRRGLRGYDYERPQPPGMLLQETSFVPIDRSAVLEGRRRMSFNS